MLVKEDIETIISTYYKKLETSHVDFSKLNKDTIVKIVFENKSTDTNEENIGPFIARMLQEYSSIEPQYSVLAANILHIDILEDFKKRNTVKYSDRVNCIFNTLKSRNIDFLTKDYVDFVNFNKSFFDTLISENFQLPFYIDYFSAKTLLGAYVIKIDNNPNETFQDLFLRSSICVFYKSKISEEEKLEKIKNNFLYIYNGYFTHATPTLFNSCTVLQQLSSCFLLSIGDSIESIYKTLSDTALISKTSGGIGFSCSDVRCEGSLIKRTMGTSSGIIPMLKVFDHTSIYVNQGGRGSKRPGAFASFLNLWHGDVINYLKSKDPFLTPELRLIKLNIGLMISDLFFKQDEIDGDWYLMCPSQCPGMTETYGEEFEKLYWKYVEEGKYLKKIKARSMWEHIAKSLSFCGEPYLVSKDNVNRFSNQKNIGVIKNLNLCVEVTEVSDENNHAVCNLASISVNRMLKENGEYDYDKLGEITEHITEALNNIIDQNYYPTPESKNSNMATRPIGIGIQGIANLFFKLKMPYETREAMEMESKIMETIYFHALKKSCELARKYGNYFYFEGSDFSKGILQFDYHKLEYEQRIPFEKWEWLRNEVKKGTRNSLLVAPMPTASTSQILGNYESFEPITSNSLARKTAYGFFKIFNKDLIRDLESLNLWNENMKNKIVSNEGSIQKISEIPENLKQIYKTVWEIKQKNIIDHAAARAPYVDQSQSMNLCFNEITIQKIRSAAIYSHKKGLKTLSYYTRSTSASKPQTIVKENDDVKVSDEKSDEKKPKIEGAACMMEEGCLVCQG